MQVFRCCHGDTWSGQQYSIRFPFKIFHQLRIHSLKYISFYHIFIFICIRIFFLQSFKVSFYRQTGTIQILCLDMLILFSIDFWLHWLHWLHLKCTGFFKIKTGYFIKFEKRKTTSFLWVRRTVVYVILTHFFKANIVRNC